MLNIVAFLALAGWILLAGVSRVSTTNLLGWLLAVLAMQWALAFFVWRHADPANSRWLTWGFFFRVAGLFAIPILEDDYFRFLWDGRIFALTGDPYGTTPSEHFANDSIPPRYEEILDQVNYPHLPTIYGPVVQYAFVLSYFVAPGVLWPWKLFLFIADLALILLLRRFGKPESGGRAAIFVAWCPLSIFETSFNAHPDAIGVTVLVAAVFAWQRGRENTVGVLCGLAIAAKIFAVLLVPFLLWRRRWPAWAAAVITVAVCYLPFWLQGSLADLNGLLVFARDWEFNSSIYAIASWALEPGMARLACGLVFAGAWLWIVSNWVRNPDSNSELLQPAALVFGLFFVLSPAFNPWYALWLLPFVALRRTATGIAILAAVSLSYITQQNLGLPGGFAHPVWVRPVEFGIIGAFLMFDLIRRFRGQVSGGFDK